MTRPVSDEPAGCRPEAVQGAGPPLPGPSHPADAAEDAARRAVEGTGITPGVAMSPTNWIVADNDMVHRGDAVRLDDGRQGVIVKVSPRGRPVVEVADGLVEVHPMRIAGRAG